MGKATVNSYRVSRPGLRWRYFQTLDEAKAFADRYYRRTGNIVAIEAVNR